MTDPRATLPATRSPQAASRKPTAEPSGAERQTEIAFAMYTALRSIADFQHDGALTADVAILRATARAALAIAEGQS